MEMITAKEIQQDMLGAQIALLEQSNAVLESAKQEPERINDLKLLGFSSSASQIEFKLQQAKELTYLESLYSIEYPSLKFIPTSVMYEVCRKYNLTIGHVSRFIGEVPTWALAQIKANKHHFTQLKMEARPQIRVASLFNDPNDSRIEWIYDDGTSVYLESGKQPEPKFRNNLMIAAPSDQMHLNFNEFRDANGQIQIRALDPIVCLQVKGGYIVLAAWDEEGKDPRVFNAQSN